MSEKQQMNKPQPMNISRTLTHALLAVTVVALVGCETMTTPEPTPTVKVSVLKPSVTPLPETKSSQEKGGVEISIAPVAYTVVERSKKSDRTVFEGTNREYTYDGTGRIYEVPVRVIERTTTSALGIDPSRLKFQVKVVNKMPRVFRGQGMVMQFNVAGKLHPVDPTAYADLVNLIVPPRNEQVVYINGPPIQELPTTCPVGLFIYDVVTQTDNAGNVIEKQNFEWYYTYATELEQRDGTVSKQRIEQKIGEKIRIK